MSFARSSSPAICDARHSPVHPKSGTNIRFAGDRQIRPLPSIEGALGCPWAALAWKETPSAREECMRDAVLKLWPEIEWIQSSELREQVTRTWEKALALSPLTPDDLNRIPFTLLVPNCPTTFMEHKRCVVHIARRAAESMIEFMGRALPINIDTVIAGAILADVGKLFEYEKADGCTRQSKRGELLRHPFTGVALAMQCAVPDAVCHIIATHAGEGDLVKRTTEAYIVHHADFMAFLPYKNLAK